MKSRQDRIAALVARSNQEREDLAASLCEISGELERRKAQWRAASFLATGLALTGTVAYRLFGKTSLSARLARAANVVSLVVGLARAIGRIRRFW